MKLILVLTALVVSALPVQARDLPTVDELKKNAQEYFKFRVVNSGPRTVVLKSAQPKMFFYVSRYVDTTTKRVEPRIIGLFEIQRPDQAKIEFALHFDEKGNPIETTGAFPYEEDTCLSYYFFTLGTVQILYRASQPNQDLWQARTTVLKSILSSLSQTNLLTGSETINMPLRPNEIRAESDQFLILSNGMDFFEKETMTAIKDGQPVEVKNLRAIYQRAGHPVIDFFNPKISASCRRLDH